MRSTHWRGAAAGAGVLAVVAIGVPVAYAASSADKTVAAGRPTHAAAGTGSERRGGHGGGPGDHRNWGHCPYPPHGDPNVSITGSAGPRGALVVHGTMRLNGCGYGEYRAGLYELKRHGGHGGDSWDQIAATTTGPDGGLSFSVSADGSASYRVLTAGQDGVAPAWSNELTIAPGKRA